MLDFIRKNNNNNLYKLENFFYLDLEIKKLLNATPQISKT